ncbi:MAG: Gfo/Idh/MocA family oxidoreductase [Armatimonadota bacterium]
MDSEIIIAGGGARGLYFAQMLHQTLGRKVAAIADTYLEGHKVITHRLSEFMTPDTKVFRTIDEALLSIPRTQANIVFVMTPEWTHLDIFRKAVGSDCHVFLEKPLATTRGDVLEILKIARSTDKTIQVGFVLRYSLFYKKIKSIIDSGVLGRLVIIQMNERLALQHGATFKRTWHRKQEYTGGFMNEKCCHDLDLMCWFKEGQALPERVWSHGGQHFCKDRSTPPACVDCDLATCPWRYKGTETLKCIDGNYLMDKTSAKAGKCVFHSDSDVMDHQMVNIVFGDGTQGVLCVSTMSADPGRDITVHGTDGCLHGELEKGILSVQNYWKEDAEEIDLNQTDAHGGGDEAIVKSFLDSIDSKNKPLATVEAGVRASLIAFAADDSVRTNAPVQLNSI